MKARLLPLLASLGVLAAARAAPAALTAGDRQFNDYFACQVDALEASMLARAQSRAEWEASRPLLLTQVAEMLGLDPTPERGPLHAVVTGKIERDDFSVEKLCFQSLPRLYVTANLYLPKPLPAPGPGILYLCGHTSAVTNGVNCGNKSAYQYHGIWFARHGYVCLVLDTLQLGEIRGEHAGTYSEGQWWWNARGYTPAGVEAWNALRGLDYLAARPEVDALRLGVTGRSGGGAYSWTLAALDDRVKVIAPVAGITDLRNQACDGVVDHHCDCMFFVNTYRWDFPLLAALAAPRPLLLGNTDADPLFPLDGVLRTRDFVKRVYALYGAETNFGLTIAPGPHQDIPELQAAVFRWFNLHLKHAGSDAALEVPARPAFDPRELKVLERVPADQINTEIQKSFVPAAATPRVPQSSPEWQTLRQTWMKGLREKCFAGWPAQSEPPLTRRVFAKDTSGLRFEAYEIWSQTNVPLRLYLIRPATQGPLTSIFLRVADASFTNALPDFESGADAAIPQIKALFGQPASVEELMDGIQSHGHAEGLLLTRGAEPLNFYGGIKGQTKLRRRFMLLGQTLDGMRVWDLCQAMHALRLLDDYRRPPLHLQASGTMAINALYPSLFVEGIDELHLTQVPGSHREGPDYLNVLKILDVPQAAAIAAEGVRLHLSPERPESWQFLHDFEAAGVSKHNVTWEK